MKTFTTNCYFKQNLNVKLGGYSEKVLESRFKVASSTQALLAGVESSMPDRLGCGGTVLQRLYPPFM